MEKENQQKNQNGEKEKLLAFFLSLSGEEVKELISEVEKNDRELAELLGEFYRKLNDFGENLQKTLSKPLTGRIILYLLLRRDGELFKEVLKKDRELHRELLKNLEELTVKTESLYERLHILDRTVGTLEALNTAVEGVKEETEKVREELKNTKEEFRKQAGALYSLLNVEIKKDGRVKRYNIPALMREIFFELAGATQERKRLTEALDQLQRLNEKLNSVAPFVYSDLPELVKETKDLKIRTEFLTGILIIYGIVSLVILSILVFKG